MGTERPGTRRPGRLRGRRPGGRRWLVSLYNNLGCSYSEAGDLDQALAAFLQAQEWAERVGTEQQRAWAREAVQECAPARRAPDAR
jgi:hypothetical protein